VETIMALDHLASTIIALRPFVPAKDMKVSQQFYVDLGFQIQSYGPDIAGMSIGVHGFLLQNYFVQQWADNFVMHVMVTDLKSWWEHIASLDLGGRYGVRPPRPPKLESWGLNVAYVFDPAGVLWHFAEEPAAPTEKGE
jgi:uncharacterized glyoxalase superfamily protein PhnB